MKRKTIIKDRFKTYLISFSAIILLITSIFIIVSSLNIKTSKNVSLLNYNEKSNIDYKVYLKENNYFKDKYLEKNKEYIASIIDYVLIDYKYSFSSSKKINADYKYKIVAEVEALKQVNNNEKKEVWNKEYELVKPKSLKIKDKNVITIAEQVKIVYDAYNEVINNFKKDYMLAVDANLIVKMLVEVNGKYVPADEVFDIDNEIKLSIPLSEQTLEINMDYKDINNDQVLIVKKVGRFNNFVFFFVGLVMLAIACFLITKQTINVIKSSNEQTKYIKDLKKILHDFGDIIVEVNDSPKLVKGKSSEVKNFSELVNAQVELRIPIVFSEIKKNELGLFILMDKDYAYYYYLKSEDEIKKA